MFSLTKRFWGKFVEFYVLIKNENRVVGLRKRFHIGFGYEHDEKPGSQDQTII